MTHSITVATFLLLIAALLSCTKGSIRSKKVQQMWDCHAAQQFDSASLAEKLRGSWKGKQLSALNNKSIKDKNVNVTFESTGKFTVTENSTVSLSGTWSLKKVDKEILGLQMDPPSVFLYGRILLCDDEVLFNNSYIDGVDNLFEHAN